jgi:hypothetical protein
VFIPSSVLYGDACTILSFPLSTYSSAWKASISPTHPTSTSETAPAAQASATPPSAAFLRPIRTIPHGSTNSPSKSSSNLRQHPDPSARRILFAEGLTLGLISSEQLEEISKPCLACRLRTFGQKTVGNKSGVGWFTAMCMRLEHSPLGWF